MFNPFYPFTKQLLEGFLKYNKKYFVRQSFERGRNILDESIKEYFLVTHYGNLTTAMDHFGAISHDPRRFLYDWNNPEHREKLLVAASNPNGYKIFASVLKPEYEKGTAKQLKNKLRTYINKIGWYPKRDEGVSSNYELQFGELYIRLKYAGREAKVKFEEIENLI
jgi:hypothetical protein